MGNEYRKETTEIVHGLVAVIIIGGTSYVLKNEVRTEAERYKLGEEFSRQGDRHTEFTRRDGSALYCTRSAMKQAALIFIKNPAIN
jgi:hypothetical protein